MELHDMQAKIRRLDAYRKAQNFREGNFGPEAQSISSLSADRERERREFAAIGTPVKPSRGRRK